MVSRGCSSICSAGSPTATRSRSSYTYSQFTEAIEFLNAGDPEPWEGISSIDTPHRLTVNGIWEVPVGRGRRFGADVNACRLGAHQRLAVLGDLHLPERLPARLRQHHLHRRSRRHRPARRASRRWRAGSTPTPASTRVSTQAAGQKRADVPAAPRERPHRQRQQRRSVAHQEHAGGRQDLELRFDSLNAFNHPYFPGPNTNPTAATFGTHQRVDTEQLRAAHADLDEVPVLTTETPRQHGQHGQHKDWRTSATSL